MQLYKMALAILVVILTLHTNFILGINGVLTTSTTNAAYKKHVVADKTCGIPVAEKYFSSSQNIVPPRFRTAKICDGFSLNNSHNASYLVDGDTRTFWQSTSMANNVNITIDFSGPMHKYYYVNSIEIEFGEFYRPMQMAFEKSTDYGETYKPWHYYVSEENPQIKCEEKFSRPYGLRPATVNSIICTKYPDPVARPQDQKVEWKPAFLRGEPDRPNNNLVDWMNVTNIRLRFLTLNKPYDPLAVLWYHYAVKEVKVLAYCDCNGHGVSCNYNETLGDNKCACQPGTCGDKCDECCRPYNQYAWKPGSKGPMVVDESSACQLCNCHNHSNVCFYNETIAKMNASLNMDNKYSGGGVCQNCQHNTEGVNCERCKPFYYRPANRSKHSPDVCELCNCSEAGSRNETVSGVVFKECLREENMQNLHPGDCLCKNNTEGRRCDRCKQGYYNLTKSNPEGCQVCVCDPRGTVNRSNICEPDDQGQCTCKLNVQGVRCDTCNDTFFGISHDNILGCQACLCNYGGSKDPICNKQNGQCPCLENIEGRQCDRPEDTAYYPDLHFIGGNTQHHPETNSWSTTFNVTTGRSNNSSLFTLILSYQSDSSQTVTVARTTLTGTISRTVALDNCSSTCYRNLTEFGEMSLSGEVTVNITYTGASGFEGKRVIALPKEFYQPDILREGQEDFLANCSVINNNPLSNSSAEFCKKGVFTITTGYLGKALECNCHSIGSNNLICDKYGGQCSCKPGVTGRKCDQCQPGFYNLATTGCTACNCSADDKVCDPVTGQCKCPPNTEGRKCDQCNITFWGWNATTGCQACNCDETGCAEPNLQCNLTTGICKCRPGVAGDQCTECQDEYKNFSTAGCSSCNCDVQGSLNPVCIKDSGQCPCKNNTMGLQCDQCKAGTFYLNEPNPKGCTDCICMGITKNCSSTKKNIYQRQLELSLWYLYDEESNQTIEVEQSLKVAEGVNVSLITANVSSAAQKLVWKASNNLTQNSLVSAYNGNLSFILHVTNLSGAMAVANPKIVIKGSHGITIEQNFSSVSIGQAERQIIFMKETAWVYAGSSSTVSRAHFLLVLAKPLSLHATASLLSGGDGYYETSFGDIMLPDVSDSPQAIAYEVEQCQCGPEYTGLSCERCAPSHYRVKVTGDSFFGKCTRCNCNNHTLDCYASSGQCYNCDHNTTSEHCEHCLDGFYGNATDGTSSDCKVCPCEAPRTTTNLCTDVQGQPKCTNCSIGYEGRLCDKCKLEYFGTPHLPGGNCSLCQCNNNSKICNTTTGECRNCSYDTTGFHCERCVNLTYGHAPSQNCTDCRCNATGSLNLICDHRTGRCHCKPHVNRRDCSECEENSYNFTESGCTECKCNQIGSSDLQCNETGFCPCKLNVTGTKCDKCKKFLYGLPLAPCKACDCNTTGSNASEPCDSLTGQCTCKPGVTGRKCDRCLVMHVNFSSNGCDPCPECARSNLQGTLNVTQVKLEKALDEANQVEKLKPLKADLNEVDGRISTVNRLIEDFNKRVKDLRAGIADIKNNTLNRTIEDLKTQLSAMMSYSNTLKQNTSEELNRVRNITNETDNALKYVRSVQQLAFDISNQLEALKTSANQMLSDMSSFLNHTFDNESSRTESELGKAETVDTLTRDSRQNVTTHRNTAELLNATVTRNEKTFNEKLVEFREIQARIDVVKTLTAEVNVLVNETMDLIAQGNIHLSSARSQLQDASALLNTSWAEIDYGRNALEEVNKTLNDNSGLSSQLTRLNNSLPSTEERIQSANLSVNVNATKHAANLTAEAKLMKNVLDSIADNAKRAVDAIKQYESVVRLVNQSLETSAKVNESLQQIMEKLNKFTSTFSAVQQSTQESYDKSQEVLNKTLSRNIDVTGLQNNVTMANRTFQHATLIGTQIDQYHNILLSRSNKLFELSEPGAANHSIYTDLTNAATYSADTNKAARSIINNSKVIQDEVLRLDYSIAYINESSKNASLLMPEAFAAIYNGTAALANVTQSNAEAQLERNKTAELKTQLETNMERLKLKLRLAKEKIAKIQHALKIHGNTTLQYNASGRIAQNTPYNDISLDFKAERNQVIQGPLLYLAEGLTDMDSSMLLSLAYNQYVRFTYDLGSAQPISITNYAVPIRTGIWYRIYASRSEVKARLTVTSYSNNMSRTYESSSNQIITRTNINITSSSPFFLGSLPDGTLPNVTRRFFYGCIDNVVVNQQRVGLWEPAKVTGNRFTCSKCLDSAFKPGFDDIIPGTSFYGSPNTYLIQSMGTFNISSTSEIVFQFRTFQKTGAIVNVLQRDQGYVYGVYLNASRVVFYFKNGSALHSLISNKTNYDNGRWYEVHVTRGLINSTLVIKDIDSQEMDVSSLALRSSLVLPKGQKLIFGGKDPQSPFQAPVSTHFAGHIRSISLSNSTTGALVSRSLSSTNLTEKYDQVNSCGILRYVQPPIRFIGRNGYAGLHTGFQNMSKLSIKFKTLNPSGVLVYSGDAATNYYFYLVLFHGNLFLINTREQDRATPVTTTGQTLNDGAFHTVDITFIESGLQLVLDRVTTNVRLSPGVDQVAPGPVKLNGTLYIGGVESPSNIPFNVPVIESFVGAMEYVEVNERRHNIFSGESKEVSLAGSSPERMVIPTPRPTIPPDPPTCGARLPERSRSGEPDQVKFGADQMYIGFWLERSVLDYMEHQHVITLNFRSLSPNGVLLYAADNLASPTQFLSVELVNGRLVFKFNTGAGLVKVRSYYNNYSIGGIWYKAHFLRIDQFGGLLVPLTRDYSNNRVGEATTSLLLNSPLFLGGVPKGTNTSMLEAVDKNGEALNFMGCMGPLEISSANETQTKKLNPRRDYDVNNTKINNASCWKYVQPQVSFGGSSYILLYENYTMPDIVDLIIHFRSYMQSGLLWVLTNNTGHGAVTLEQYQGQIILKFISESNQTTMKWTHPPIQGKQNHSFYQLCDNKFHSVRVQRSGSTVKISVDQHKTETFSVNEDFSLTGKFYVGGVPNGEGYPSHRGSSGVRLQGCVQSLTINTTRIDLLREPVKHFSIGEGCRSPPIPVLSTPAISAK